MHLKGILLLPGLPNSTSVTQEMDDLFSTFKSLCRSNTKQLFAARTLERSLKVNNGEETKAGHPPIVASLCNDDLSFVVNGDETRNNPKERPFDYCYTKEKIFKSWMNVGFMPFTRACLHNKKVRHILGDGGGNSNNSEKINSLSIEYTTLKHKAKDEGMNIELFALSIPCFHKNPVLQKTEDEQIDKLVNKKGAFQHGSQWVCLGTQLHGSSALIKAQVKQLQLEEEMRDATAEKLQSNELDKHIKAKAAFDMYKLYQKNLKKEDWKDIVKFILPIIHPNTAPSKLQSVKKIKEKLHSCLEEHGEPWDAKMERELGLAHKKLKNCLSFVMSMRGFISKI